MKRRRVGPGLLIAAAFIGPGTVTTATLAGANHGYVLGWGIVFSTLATLVLQEMAARLGVAGRLSLGQALRQTLTGWRFGGMAALIVLAIFIGNVAYEGGNLSGALLGAEGLPGLGKQDRWWLLLLLAVCAAALLWHGSIRVLQGVLGGLVALLSLLYVYAAVSSQADWGAALAGLLPLRLPTGAELTLVALVGTTVVPYNLFLHAATAQLHYASANELAAARRDTYLSVVLGGVVTLAIAITAAAARTSSMGPITTVQDLAEPLHQVLGVFATYTLGVGYLAAGLSSAITAPLAAAIAVQGVFAWSGGVRSWRFRGSWMLVLGAGLGFALSGIQPIPLIVIAQVANGILLPIVAGLLLWVVNDRQVLGEAVNSPVRNLLGFATLALVTLLGLRALARAIGIL